MKIKKHKIFNEFKEFITRGNVIDLAVGIIIGTAFTAIVNSLVNDVMMPGIGFLINGADFTTFRWILKEGIPADSITGAAEVKEVAIYYGKLLQQIINFFLIALVVFFMVKVINMLRRNKKIEEKEVLEPSITEIDVLQEIRDLLKCKNEN